MAFIWKIGRFQNMWPCSVVKITNFFNECSCFFTLWKINKTSVSFETWLIACRTTLILRANNGRWNLSANFVFQTWNGEVKRLFVVGLSCEGSSLEFPVTQFGASQPHISEMMDTQTQLPSQQCTMSIYFVISLITTEDDFTQIDHWSPRQEVHPLLRPFESAGVRSTQ